MAPLRTCNESVSSDSDHDETANWLHTWSHNELEKMQQSEPAIKQMVRLKQTFNAKQSRHIVLNASQYLKTLWGLSKSLIIIDNLLYYKWNTSDNEVLL